MDIVSYHAPGPVAEQFIVDSSFVSGLLGPVGSGKSSAAVWKMVIKALQQKPHNGTRSSRWAVIRNTFPELKSTTIKTWLDWFPEPVSTMRWDSPITAHLRIPDIGDSTALDMEVLFFPLDRPEEVGKLKSLELTGGWINEASETEKAVLDMLTQRVGRFPAARRGGPTWTGVIMDTNPPADDSWWYHYAEEETPAGWKFFRQPGGLYFDVSRKEYLPNLDAENVNNLPGGHHYYFRQLAGKDDGWINVFLLANYGNISTGKPVYPEWSDKVHVAEKAIEPIPGIPLLLGFDFGLTPACAIGQLTPRGRLHILRELHTDNMGIRQFATEVVRPTLVNDYPRFKHIAFGDPAGNIRAQTDEKTCLQELNSCGIPTDPADTNEFVARREAVAFWLTRMSDGKPAFQLDPSCKLLRRAFNGGYCYDRLQVVGSSRFKDRPTKNYLSHISDAVQYLALQARAGISPVRVREQKKRSAKGWT